VKYFNSVSEIIPWIRGEGGSLINPKGEEALAELEAIVARDADVRTLDEWAKQETAAMATDRRPRFNREAALQVFGDLEPPSCTFHLTDLTTNVNKEFEGPNPDAARRAAAEWLRGQKC
jgi:hypothetical protein